MVGEARQQELEAVGHSISSQEAERGILLPHFLLFTQSGSPAHRKVRSTVKVGLSHTDQPN